MRAFMPLTPKSRPWVYQWSGPAGPVCEQTTTLRDCAFRGTRCGGVTTPRVHLFAHRVDQMRDAVAWDDGRVLEQHRRAREVGEERDARAEDHRRELDADLVEQSEIETLLRDVRPGDADPLVAGLRPRELHRTRYAVGHERRERWVM